MPAPHRVSSRLALVAALLASAITRAASQEVVVFDRFPSIPGEADATRGQRRGVDQTVLVIPVISQDTPFDPNANLLAGWAPTLRADLIAKFAEMNALWQENSYGEVSFSVDVLERYYQMPREVDHYFNPAYVTPTLSGTAVRGPMVTVPTGQVRLRYFGSAADQATIDLDFDIADSPYTLADLETAVVGMVSTVVGSKVTVTSATCGADCVELRFTVAQTVVRAGTSIHVDFSASDADVLDVLGLDRPEVDLAIPRVTGAGAEFPFTPTVGQTLRVTVENGVDPPESFDWVMGAGALATPNAFVVAHGATHPAVAMTVVGGELRFTVAPTIAGPYSRLAITGPPDLLDRLGFAASTEMDGTINLAKQNTIKGERRFIAGQAVAAYAINELTRDPAAPGPDPSPNIAIEAANEPDIRAFLEAEIDPYRLVAVIFLDAPLKRAGASGGYLPIGLRNGAFEMVHMTSASVQIQFDFSGANTIAHETGHNIGFVDLYNNSDGEYDPGLDYPRDWDLMHDQTDKPHTGVWHKEVDNGWLSATGAVVAVMPEPNTTGATVTERYLLTPLELSAADYDDQLAVPAGRTLAKAVRLPIGLDVAAEDHFLLIQNRQAGAGFGLALPQHPAAAMGGGVYITDAISRRSFDFFLPGTRNYVHPLTSAPLVAGNNVSPILDEAPNPDIAFTMAYPAYAGLEVDIVGQLNGPAPFANRPAYLIDVTREQDDFLELGITPWGAPPWESPDIWIEHGDKATLSSVPLTGNGERTRWAAGYDPAANGGQPLNWVRALVTNSGTVDATDVTIWVRVNQPGGMGDANDWVILGESAQVDIPAGDSRILQVPWNPSVKGHTCVQVMVYRWVAPLGDRNPWNNRTQENVTLFEPTASSPWGATPFSFEIANGRSFPLDVVIEPENLRPGYLLTVERSFVTVPAEASVLLHGTLELDDAIIPPPSGFLDRDSVPFKPRRDVFHLNAYAVGGDYQVPVGGITYVVIPSVRVDVDAEVGVDGNGDVTVTGSTEPVAPGIEIEIEVRYPSGRYQWVTVTTNPDGSFGTTIPAAEDGKVQVTVRIPGGQGAAPAEAGVEVVDTEDRGRRPLGARGRRIELFFGGILTDDGLALDAGLEWGVRSGVPLFDAWRLEGELGVGETDSDVNDGLLVRGQIQIVRTLGSSWLQPFVLAGGGVAHLNGRGRSDTQSLLTVGVGADAQWHGRLSLRMDLRYLRLGGLFGGRSSSNWQVQWGPAFRF